MVKHVFSAIFALGVMLALSAGTSGCARGSSATPPGAQAMRAAGRAPVTGLALFDGKTSLYIEQDGIRLPIQDGVVQLERRPFALVFELSGDQHVMFNASINPDHSERIKAGLPHEGMFAFWGTGLAEHEANRERLLRLRNDTHHSQGTPNRPRHRYDRLAKDPHSNRYTAHRTVAQLKIGRRGKAIPIAEYRYDRIYFVFIEPPPAETDFRALVNYQPGVLTLQFPERPDSRTPPGVAEWRDREEFWYDEHWRALYEKGEAPRGLSPPGRDQLE